jgi:hypothetical protein
MAVYQISRIQIRRGKKNEGTGMPQLAGGELAWAIDTQELYIGSGSVSDGAPAVGNTKILTEYDNILDLAEQYQYKSNNADIQTGTDANYPVRRTLQDRLDDRVSAAAYGIVADETDQAEKIQNAIDNLFLNPANVSETSSRVILEFAPGTYVINQTIYIPSNTTILGSGIEKTVFAFTGTGPVFEFINDTSSPLDRNTVDGIEYNYQPKFISMKNFSVTTIDVAEILRLYSVRDSQFENIRATGTWESADGNESGSIGLGLYAFSNSVTCQRNKFVNVTADGFCYGVYSKTDIFNNTFDDCKFQNAQYGIAFGIGTNGSSTGEVYGPRKNIIKNCLFETIDRQGIIVDTGYGNRSRGNTFIDVGNDGGGNSNNTYSQITFTQPGNTSNQDNFDRAIDLASDNWTDPYLAEVEGSVFRSDFETKQINITQSPTPVEAFRIPVNKNTGIIINYVFKSTAYDQMRSGKLTVAVDYANSTIQLVDDFEYTGTIGEEENLMFSSSLVDDNIIIYYANDNVGDSATLTYTHSTLS